MSTRDPYALTWERHTFGGYAPPSYSTTAPLNGEPRAFAAEIRRDGRQGYALTMSTHARPLGGPEWFRDLAAARAAAAAAYRAVESVNR